MVSWQLMLVRGVLAVLFGAMAIAWPNATITVIAVLWGVWALMDGISSLAAALRPGPTGARLALGLVGVVALVAAFFAIFRPVEAATFLTWVLGLWLIARGVMELALAFSDRRLAPRWFILLGAALDFLLGLVFVANPGRSVVGIAWLLGLIALVWGLVFITLALVLRKQTETLGGPTPPPPPPPAVPA